jgi:hypothetical protein
MQRYARSLEAALTLRPQEIASPLDARTKVKPAVGVAFFCCHGAMKIEHMLEDRNAPHAPDLVPIVLCQRTAALPCENDKPIPGPPD